MNGTAALGVLLAGVLMLAVGWFGHLPLRKGAPVLARFPRLAIALLFGGVLIWPAAIVAVVLAFAWVVTGPDVLPMGAAQVCQQCVAAANPFTLTTVETGIPSVTFLLLPIIAGALGTAGVAAQYFSRLRRSRELAGVVLAGSSRQWIHGYQVALATDEATWALSFSRGQGGIVLSTGACERLDKQELIAVLEHEEAHLRQRHHLIADLVASIAAQLRWVPFIREAAAGIPAYLEIAADDQARSKVGTTALVRALLILGERVLPTGVSGMVAGPLPAAGPERIPHLVSPAIGQCGLLPAAAATIQLMVLSVVSVVVLSSYANALLSGCI
ncbi:M56 family metallopeptidase [Corynebacterium alimapuense]|uniref:Zn-dependent protease n=1 Tax=Corynebacterium alimapuense TaxID=1576874 RepID=A0A3M8K7H9_9CORY|nr:M56 family metallopeptidase [Corynebacterium alimapuense]RNE48522.1 Zn-dependent protease [Corynebacterium alimapuense]